MEITTTIPTENIPALKVRLAQANKQAAKCGVAALILTQGETVTKTRKLSEKFEESYQETEIILTGETPKYEGWSFVASLELGENGAIIRSLVGTECPSDQRNRGNVCDHCGHSRNRKHTYVVINEDGSVKQIGRQCLKEFMGNGRFNPEFIARWFEMLVDLSNSNDDDGYGGARSEDRRYTMAEILQITGAVIARKGWVSSNEAKFNDTLTRTSSEVSGILSYKRNSYYIDYAYEAFRREVLDDASSEARKEESTEALAWLMSQEANSDYMHTCQVIAKDGWVDCSRFAFTCSILPTFRKAMSREVERATREEKAKSEAADSVYIGEIGDRLTITVNVSNVKVLESRGYGESYLHFMHDENGNSVKWFASSRPLEVGQHTVKATVKDHREYKGMKETLVTRVKEVV